MSTHLNEAVDPATIKTIKDLIDATKAGIKIATGNKTPINKKDAYSYSSTAKAASKLIAVYPVLISKTVSANTAQMVSKYIEQKGCIIIQLALQMMNISNAENGAEYLRRFHQNLNIGGDDVAAMASIINAMLDDVGTTRSVQHNSATIAGSIINEKFNEFNLDGMFEHDDSIKISNQQMKELMEMFSDAEKYQIYDTELNERSINDFIIKESAGDYRVTFRSFNEDQNYDPNKKYGGYTSTEIANDDTLYQKYRRNREIYNNDIKDEDRKKEKDNERKEKDNERDTRIKNTVKNIQFLKDQDIKKMNSAVPSLIIVRFYNSSTASVATEFIIGVKSKALAVDSNEILRRIANDNKDGKAFLNVMRAITGELKMTDFLFGLSRTREDLKSIKVKGAYGDTWALLQNRALAAKTAIAKGQRNDFSAITTVVISREDADDLYKEENLDITDPTVAKHFMESYNLLGFAIVDDALESVKFMFDDGNRYFEEFSYRMLAKETETETYKSMLKLMANNR